MRQKKRDAGGNDIEWQSQSNSNRFLSSFAGNRVHVEKSINGTPARSG